MGKRQSKADMMRVMKVGDKININIHNKCWCAHPVILVVEEATECESESESESVVQRGQ